MGREGLALRALRSSWKAELASASDDELLTTWEDFGEFVSGSPRVVRRSLVRRQRAVERELRSRGIAPPEKR
jgi:hypothetical protein